MRIDIKRPPSKLSLTTHVVVSLFLSHLRLLHKGPGRGRARDLSPSCFGGEGGGVIDISIIGGEGGGGL